MFWHSEIVEYQYKVILLSSGILKELLQHIDYNPEGWAIQASTVHEIKALRKLAMDISDNAIPFIQSTDPTYYSRKFCSHNTWTVERKTNLLIILVYIHCKISLPVSSDNTV